MNLLSPATKLWQGNIFTGICHSVHMGGMHGKGACIGMWHGGHAWWGGVHGRGACVVEGMHGRGAMHGRWCVWQGEGAGETPIAVRILLECILVRILFWFQWNVNSESSLSITELSMLRWSFTIHHLFFHLPKE